jgi:hypothetical protein
MWVDPSWIEEWFMRSALPAFLIGAVVVSSLGRLGVNQIWSFVISMPLLILIWYYFVGWLIDRLKSKRAHSV